MNFLYILTEDENDDIFFEGCLETLTGKSFQILPYRLRKGSGLGAVRSSSRLLLQTIRRTGHVDSAYFVIAMDNDRSPEHPDHQQLPNLSKQDTRKSCRFCEIKATIIAEPGEDRANWPIKGVIAVPVEMLESWLFLICNVERPSLPPFARKTQSSAQKYYAPSSPPDQLKDLCRIEQDKLSVSSFAEFCLHCAHALDAPRLASASASFALFKAQVEEWD